MIGPTGFPLIVGAARRMRAASFLIDGEAVICRPAGISDFEALRGCRSGTADATLVDFDLIELQGNDLRNDKPITRKQTLARMLSDNSTDNAIVYNEHLEHDGALVFDHACRMGLEGIVSKRLDAPYRSGPSKVGLKSKNPLSEAVRREWEKDWG
ncbi:MAG: hypothetical protein WA303_19370 [Bradyrhizobium sp.]|jgi:bifunctional non-homologous end joining protein LigD